MGPRASRRSRWLVAAAVLLAVAAGGIAAVRGPGIGSELTNSRPSAEALARAVLENLEEKDRRGLESLLVTREEYRQLLWEQLPESRTHQFGYVRALSERHTRDALDRALARYGGRAFELVDVSFAESEREEYMDFTLHRKATLTVRHEKTGRTGKLPILDDFVEWKGEEWKLLDYEE